MSTHGGAAQRRSKIGLGIKAILVALGVLFVITLRAFPEAYGQSAKPFTEFISAPVVGFITVGALLLLVVTMLTAIGTRDATLAALVAVIGSLVFSALYAFLLVQPGEYCRRTLTGAITGAPECSPDYTPQILALAYQMLTVFPLAAAGLSPLAFYRKARAPLPEPLASVQVPSPAAVVQPSQGPAPTAATPRPAPPVYRPPPPPAVRTVTPPVVRAPPPPPPAPELHPMNSYVVLGTGPQSAYTLFRKALSTGSPGLCISRTHPDEVRRAYGLPGSARIHWLSKAGEKDALNPANMEQMFALIQEFLGSQKGAALLFDGVEYLAGERDFPRVLKFLNNLQDAVAVNKAILLVPVNPAALGEKEVGLLSRDMKIIKS